MSFNFNRVSGIATMCMAPLARGRMFGRSDLAKMAQDRGGGWKVLDSSDLSDFCSARRWAAQKQKSQSDGVCKKARFSKKAKKHKIEQHKQQFSDIYYYILF